MQIVLLLIGIVVGFLIGFLVGKQKNPSTVLDTSDFDKKINTLETDKLLLKRDVEHAVTEKETLRKEFENKKTEILKEKEFILAELNTERNNLSAANARLAKAEEAFKNQDEKLKTQKLELEEIQKKLTTEFENIANKILDEKSKKFTETNKTNIETLLNPLKEDIHKFKEKVEATHSEDTKQRTSLEERIKGLIEQTNKVSAEANNLATALKGKAQKRGNWGEMILERILESSGLTKDREYFVQQSIKDEDGKTQRLDVKVNLPDDRVIIIDSKVSLIAYENYFASEDSDEQKKFLTEHIKATQLHIDQLSEKKYDNIETSLDFTMMFIPIEPAYLLAIQGNPDLWSYAYSKRILLVSPTTLIACLKLFSDLWRRDWQNKNALEIAKQSGALYDKFVGFIEDLQKIGIGINQSQKAYDEAFKKLKEGNGNLISRAQKIEKLGAKATKALPQHLLDDENQQALIGNE